MKLKVDVKKSHIKRGMCNDAYRCAVALALRRAGRSHGIVDVSVDGNFATLYTDINEKGARVFLPKRVVRFIETFDKVGGRSKLKPFSFTLSV